MSLPRLSRPTLSNPLVIDLDITGYADSEARTVKVPSNRDCLIRYPKHQRVGHLQILGGATVCIAGGYQTIGAKTDGSYPMQGSRTMGDFNIEVKDGDPGRLVHIEGVHIDASGGAQSDGFFINAPESNVQLLSCRVEGLLGSLTHGRHADGVQTPSGCQWLALDRCTIGSHYNTLYLRRENSPLRPPVKKLTIRCSNTFGYDTNPAAGTGDPQYTLRGISLGTQPEDTDCNAKGQCGPANNLSSTNAKLETQCEFDRFFIDPESAGRQPGRWVFPDQSSGTYQPVWPEYDTVTGTLFWPLWEQQGKIKGRIRVGKPTNGDFAKAAAVGLHYPNGIWAP